MGLPVEKWLRDFSRPHGWLVKPVQALQRFIEQIKIAGQHSLLVVSVLPIVLTYMLLLSVSYTTFFELTTTVHVPLAALLAVEISMAIATNLPISVNGIGLREQLHYLLFASLGISKEVAVSISLIMLFNSLIISVLGYFFWIRLRFNKTAENTVAPTEVQV
jgi:hypothetical protein